jgi:hypothetical protein
MSKFAILIAALIALAVPSVAGASTFCVSDASCSGTDEGADVQKALDDAKANPGPDRVQIGAGSFSAGPYTYADGAAGNGVEIAGAGPATTTLTGPAASGVLAVAGGASSVSNVGIDIGVVGGKGLVFSGPSQADHVKVTSTKASTEGVELAGGSLSDSTVALPVPAGAVNNAVSSVGGQGTTATLDDDTLTGQRALSSIGKGAVVVHRLHALAQQTLFPTCGQLTVDSSVVDTIASKSSQGVTASAANTCPVTVTIRHSTIVGHGGASSSGVFAVSVSPSASTVALHDSIVTGFNNDIRRLADAGVVNVATFFSAYDAATTSDVNSNGGTGALSESGRIDADPHFADLPGADFRLAGDSALIDAGDPNGLAPGESTTDADGHPREVDARGTGTARSDVGAFEHDALPAPPPPPPPAPQSGGSSEPPPPATTTPETPATTTSDAPSAPAESTPPAPGVVPPPAVAGDPPRSLKRCRKPHARHRRHQAKRAATCRKVPKHKRHHRRHVRPR